MKNRFWIIVFSAVLAVCSLTAFFLSRAGGSPGEIGVFLGGKRLAAAAGAPLYIRDGEGGVLNVVEITEDGARMLEASCPDQTCVAMGYLRQMPIVCLPNRVVIRYITGARAYDAISR
jgi:hypothetical protein